MTETPTTVAPEASPDRRARNGARPVADGAHGDGEAAALRLYADGKLALAAQLRALRDILRQRGSERRLRQCEDLLGKLAEDRFTLAVLGQFKRGKSSLMNAILGRELLPVGALPLTSALTVLRYGPRERLLITRSDARVPFPREEPVGRLAEFVTETNNPGNRKHVKTACVELPHPFLRRGLEFVDTPGIGSAIATNTATTLNFLPECDAVLFVTSVEAPLTEAELGFLRTIREHVHKLFFVVNKTDLLGAGERAEVLDFIRATLARHMGAANVKVYPVSSRLGLAAKRDGDGLAAGEHGLTALENALARFLSGEKAAVFLAAIADKAQRLLEQESAEIQLREHARAIPDSVLRPKLEALAAGWRQYEAERKKTFARLREHVSGQVALALTPELQSFLTVQAARLAAVRTRWLARARWRPGTGMLKRGAVLLLRQVRRNTGRWLAAQTERLGFGSDAVAHECWHRLEANLADIPALAARVLGGSPSARPASGLLPPWRLDVQFDPPWLAGLRWETNGAGLWAALPARWTHRWLNRRLQTDCERLLHSCRREVLAAAVAAVNQALDRRWDEIEHAAEESSARVLAILTGRPLAAADQVFDGKPVRVDSDFGRARLEAVRERLNALRSAIGDWRGSDATSRRGGPELGVEPPEFAGPHAPITSVNRVSKVAAPAAADCDFSGDLQTRGCPVCEHLTRAAFAFLSRFQHDLAQDESTQQEFAELLGFCALHTWQLEAVSSPVGVAAGFAPLAGRVSRLLAARAESPAGAHTAAKLIRDRAECHICRWLREAEQTYLRGLTGYVEKPEGRARYARAQGVCLPHLGLWLPFLTRAETARFVLEEAARRFEQLSEDLQSFRLKTEAFRRQLRNDDERDACWRAIVHLVGAKACCAAGSENAEM